MDKLLNPLLSTIALISLWASCAHAEQFDTSFNGTGQLTLGFPSNDRKAIAMLERPDGGLMLISAYPCNAGTQACLALFILNPDGSYANASEGGFNGVETVTAAAMDSRGRIVIVGTSVPNINGMRNFIAQRRLPDGSIDTSFGNSGDATVDFFGLDDYASAVTVDANDNVVIVGEARYTSTDSDFGVVRLRGSDGMLDLTFNGTGKATVSFDLGTENVYDRARGVAIAASGGRITVVGTAFDSSIGLGKNKVAIARLNNDGSFDTSFCNASCTFQGSYTSVNNGRRVYYFGDSTTDDDSVYGVALLGNGDLYIVGGTYNGSIITGRPAIARIFSDGDYAAETITATSGVRNYYRSVQVSDAIGQRVLVSGDFNDGHLVLQAFTSNLALVAGYGDCMSGSAFCIAGNGGVSDYGPDVAGLLSVDRGGRPLFAGTYVAASGNYQKALFARFTNATGPKPDSIFRNGF